VGFPRSLAIGTPLVIEDGSGTNGNWDMSMIEGTMEIAQNAALMAQARTM